MRARDVVDRRIVGVHQSRHYDPSIGQTVWSLDSIEIDDGRRIVFHAHDDGYGYYVTANTVLPAHQGSD